MKKMTAYAAILLLLIFLLCSLYVVAPVSRAKQMQALVRLEEERHYVLNLPDSKRLFLRPFVGADTLCTTCIDSVKANIKYSYVGFFVDANGVVQTIVPDSASAQVRVDSGAVVRLLKKEVERVAHRSTIIADYKEELEYYLHTHDVDDEGYNAVTDVYEQVLAEQHATDSLRFLLDVALGTNHLEVELSRQVVAFCQLNDTDSVRVFRCLPTENADQWCMETNSKPRGLYHFDLARLRFWGTNRDTLVNDLGAPVIDRTGAVRGVIDNGGVRPLGGFRFSICQWWYSVIQWWQWVFASKDVILPSLPDGPVFQRRQVDGITYEGLWHGDTLPEGRRLCGDSIYYGEMDSLLRPSGNGVLLTPVSFYQGEWKEGLRCGFGVGLEPGEIVRCGQWRTDSFVGEQMIYTDKRVYGIDISRYQHEQKRRRYSINWSNLRITGLGRKHRANVRGAADFPVSFCYIKATQGIRIKSNYYAADARAARSKGIAVGAYHFFAPTSGQRQADFFMRNACPRRGDLPPMLDVELTDKQIRQMGGVAVLHREMLAWLRSVGSRTGTRPVLYVSQTFVNRYLQQAPAELRQYPVWIARYSEYRPYVRLQYWQLSADGSVRGIRGDVDIDVFNGTHEQFHEYCEHNCVR